VSEGGGVVGLAFVARLVDELAEFDVTGHSAAVL